MLRITIEFEEVCRSETGAWWGTCSLSEWEDAKAKESLWHKEGKSDGELNMDVMKELSGVWNGHKFFFVPFGKDVFQSLGKQIGDTARCEMVSPGWPFKHTQA